LDDVPKYADLPVSADAPPGSAWGVFGRDDELGTLNFLTPERRAGAARLVKRGVVFNLDLPLHLPARPFFPTRRRPSHIVERLGSGNAQDDRLDGFNTQYSSQWDGLRHVRHRDYGFYNWTSEEDASRLDGRLGMQNFARHGIVGRGVLLDVARHTALPPDEYYPIPSSLLDDVAAAQCVTIQPGDIVLLRTGMAAMLHREADQLSNEVRSTFATPGLDQGEESLAWLWDHQVAAIAADNVAVEAWPPNRDKKALHSWGIALLGLVFGELFDFETLADDCADDGVYECLFVAKPLHLHGGVGSPANALAMK
jgi:kynurenine formamidase